MAYSAISKPSVNFNTVLYNGNGSAGNAVTGVGFAPNFVWIKERTSTSSHVLGNTISGVNKRLQADTTAAEGTLSNLLTSFDTDGFTNGADNGVNENSQTYVSWNWKAGGAVSGNTTGSGSYKSYTGSINAAAGFSIIAYGGNGTAGHTIPHRLSATPDAIIVKNRSDAWNWSVYHKDAFTSQAAPGVLYLNTNAAKANDTNVWGNSSVTINSTVFSLGDYDGTNQNNSNFMAYCFAGKKGYSKFGSYTGNGNANGTFVYTGFKPAFFFVKNTGTTDDWFIYDNKRDPNNFMQTRLRPNTTTADTTNADYYMDFFSNGFKFRTANSGFNADTNNYIYMAFAEEPLVANVGIGVPATAR